jgi:hypothetical protein
MLTDPDTRRHLGGPVDEEVLREAMTRTPGQLWGSFLIALAGSGEVAGSCSLDRGRGELEVSY